MTTGPIISIRNVTKSFGEFVAVDDVSIDIAPGEFFALLGPSGCGKTTLLRMIAGFESPTRGSLLLDGEDMTDLPPNKRPVNMVFQSYAVFPHMSVAKNVGYGLKVEGTPAAEIALRVDEALELTQLQEFKDRKPDQLSGGQRQRVALARALVKRPRVLLLDEPLSALDAKLRDAMRLELVRLQNTIGITFVMVTHDQSEALSMADRIAVLDAGRLKQLDGPKNLYEKPRDVFVADFIGKANLLDVSSISQVNGHAVFTVSGVSDIALPISCLPMPSATAESLALAVRPEKLMLHREPSGNDVHVRGRVTQIAYQGENSLVVLDVGGGRTLTASLRNTSADPALDLREGADIWCSWSPDDTLVLPRSGGTS